MPPGSAREYSYTDKRGGFYYGRAGADSAADWHAGWNVDARRIFADYELRVDGSPLERASAVCVVYPDRLVRRFGAAVETFCVLDSPRVLWVGVDSVRGSRISIALKGGSIADARFDGGSVLYVPKESPGRVVRVAPAEPEGMEFAGGTLSAPASARGFVIALGSEQESADAIDGFRLHGKEWMEARTRRMQGLLDSNPLRSSSDSLDRAMAWLMLTNDGLVTRQHGGGGRPQGIFPSQTPCRPYISDIRAPASQIAECRRSCCRARRRDSGGSAHARRWTTRNPGDVCRPAVVH